MAFTTLTGFSFIGILVDNNRPEAWSITFWRSEKGIGLDPAFATSTELVIQLEFAFLAANIPLASTGDGKGAILGWLEREVITLRNKSLVSIFLSPNESLK